MNFSLARLERLLVAAAPLLIFLPATVRAQPGGEGRMGPTSSASVQIRVSVAPRFVVQQSNGGRIAPAAAVPGASIGPLCISSNSEEARYSVTASDASAESGLNGEVRAAGKHGFGGSKAFHASPPADAGSAGVRPSSAPADLRMCPSQSMNYVVMRDAGASGPTAPGHRQAVLLLIAPD